MSKITRWALCAAAIMVSVVGTAIWCSVRSESKPPVPLTAGLRGTWAAASAELDGRVKAKFPLGSSDTDMGAELVHQGFSRQDWNSSPNEEHEAVRHEDNIVCRKAARIHWRVNNEGRLTAIRGEYREEGCL